MSEPRDVFTSDPLSVERVMMEPGRGFYVPIYQRPYAWKIDSVGALLTNISEGLDAVREMDDAITFIGALIFVHDTQYKTVEPQVRNELPQGVFLVIDGQQRLTCITLMALSLHDAVRRLEVRIAQQRIDIPWLQGLTIELSNRLEQILLIDKHLGDEHFRYYPRMIRAHEDSWSYHSASARYVSPTASVLAAYIRHVKGNPAPARSAFKWTAADAAPPERIEEFKLVEKTLRHIHKYLDRIAEARGAEDDETFPEETLAFGEISNSPDLQQRYFKNAAPAEVISYWKDRGQPNSEVNRICRLLMFARYLLERVAVTQVLVKREEYAFDLFEALNTTGEPLTAYETFRPLVIKTEGLDKFRTSPSAAHMDRVEQFLSRHVEDRAKASDRILIPFALLERGFKLGKHLRDQRNWLRRNYDEGGLSPAAKRTFLHGMSVVAQFLDEVWDGDDDGGAKLEAQLAKVGCSQSDRSDIMLCLRVLADSNHEITVALFARFYEFLLGAADDARRTEAAAEFAAVTRAVVGFFALWRGSRAGTENIDHFYRKLMLEGLPPDPQPFRRIETRLPSASLLMACMRHKLEEKGIAQRAGWVERASSLNVYQQSRELTRLLLLAAAHDEIPDTDLPGLTKAGKADSCPMLNFESWASDLQIEHIAPQTSRPGIDGWPGDIYSRDLDNTLGNLILLPPDSNASASNRAWKVKSIYYRVISTDDPAEVARLIATAAAEDVAIQPPTQELLGRAKYLPHLRALCEISDGAWTAEFVVKRSRSMAEKAWARLAPWVGLDPEK